MNEMDCNSEVDQILSLIIGDYNMELFKIFWYIMSFKEIGHIHSFITGVYNIGENTFLYYRWL